MQNRKEVSTYPTYWLVSLNPLLRSLRLCERKKKQDSRDTRRRFRICFPYWNKMFPLLKQSVSLTETECFSLWNTSYNLLCFPEAFVLSSFSLILHSFKVFFSELKNNCANYSFCWQMNEWKDEWYWDNEIGFGEQA